MTVLNLSNSTNYMHTTVDVQFF